jgi:hypothetical protein
MAYSLYLIRRQDMTSDGPTPDKFDLQKYLTDEGWQQGSPQGDEPSVDEAIMLHLKPDSGTYTDNGLATIVRPLIEGAAGQRRSDSQIMAWLRAKQYNETYRAGLHSARRSPQVRCARHFRIDTCWPTTNRVCGPVAWKHTAPGCSIRWGTGRERHAAHRRNTGTAYTTPDGRRPMRGSPDEAGVRRRECYLRFVRGLIGSSSADYGTDGLRAGGGCCQANTPGTNDNGRTRTDSDALDGYAVHTTMAGDPRNAW